MKKSLLLFLLILFCFPVASYAHSGGTDADGGHYNRSTGEYHYHHGYSAHQHTDGICPYDFKDNTVQSSSSSNNTFVSEKQRKTVDNENFKDESNISNFLKEFEHSHPFLFNISIVISIIAVCTFMWMIIGLLIYFVNR